MYPLKEYSDLVNLIEKDQASREDLYQELINKERDVLDVISRVATQRDVDKQHKSLFINITISEAIARFANVWSMIFTETIDLAYSKRVPTSKDFHAIFLQGDRKIYIGVMMILISLLIFFISITQQ